MFAVLAYVTVMLGHVSGEEIAPQTFQRRTFAYYQLPVVQLQISGITRSDSTGLLEDFLVDEKLITVANRKTPPHPTIKWDLVTANRMGMIFSRGEAEILCHYLDAKNVDDKLEWVEWSEEHPDLAKVIWPVVVSVAQQELYIFVPELMELAANATDPVQLKQQLDQLQSEQYQRVATTQQQLGRHELAVELFTHSLDRTPDRIPVLEKRAVSLAALGEQENADADLAEIRKLKRF